MWVPISLSSASGSTAIQIRYKLISSSGQHNVVPPVPNLTERIPSFFKALIILRIVTGLQPVDNDSSSLVTRLLSPYSFIKIRQWIAMEHLVLMCMIQECKIPSPQAILNGFCIVTVNVLNSYIILKIT